MYWAHWAYNSFLLGLDYNLLPYNWHCLWGAALNRFISRSADRYRHFFLLINKWKGFEWIEECATAFQQLKDYLARPSIMSSPEPDKVLFAYIAVAPYAVSLVLIRVDSSVQRPVYYVSKSLHEAKVRYLPLEKVGSSAWHT